jgi:tRNA pseudouridine32 synthase/23S rRNA pseudouridine746 synthase
VPINIVDEQDDFIVVDKPAGINFHDEGELQQGFFNQVKQLGQYKELYPVHRLDKMTSGLIIFAKNLACAQCFQRMFEQHQIEKYYLAVSDKKPKKKQGLVKGDMAKSRRGMWKLLRTQENPAISQFLSFPLSSDDSKENQKFKGKRLYIIKPHSGKTHQIRVALASVGAPIFGDTAYHSIQEQDRGYLHAFALRFSLNNVSFDYVLFPTTGEFFSPLTKANIEKTTAKQAIKTITHQHIEQPWCMPWPKI